MASLFTVTGIAAYGVENTRAFDALLYCG